MLLSVEEGSERSQQHEHERGNCQHTARGRATAQSHRRRGQSRESRSLPEEVQQRPFPKIALRSLKANWSEWTSWFRSSAAPFIFVKHMAQFFNFFG